MAREIPEKLFYRIGEVAEITGVKPHVLRYWESEFKMLRPRKNRSGQRIYEKRDVELILEIKELLYDHRYTIPGAQKKLNSIYNRKEGEEGERIGREKLLELLKEFKEELESIRHLLEIRH
ncbi:MAG: MerR family transcriptional regulator [Nitrospinota bacterium]|nr:MAG: MerR family transcriptional regulator [Nitrospinota bacterium]